MKNLPESVLTKEICRKSRKHFLREIFSGGNFHGLTNFPSFLSCVKGQRLFLPRKRYMRKETKITDKILFA